MSSFYATCFFNEVCFSSQYSILPRLGAEGANREIAFYKASAIAQGTNIVRRELGLATTCVPAAHPKLQIDVVPGRDAARAGG